MAAKDILANTIFGRGIYENLLIGCLFTKVTITIY